MESNAGNKYRSSTPTADRKNSELVTRSALWAAMAHDYGAFNADKQKKGLYDLVGFNDLRYVDDDLYSLFKAEKVKEPDLSSIKAIDAGQVSLRLEERLHRILPVYLNRLILGVRFSEPLHAVYDLAALRGYIDNQGNATDKLSEWHRCGDGSEKLSLEFLTDLQRHYREDQFHELISRRESLAERDLNEQLSLVGTLLERHGRFHATVIDFGVHRTSIPFGASQAGYQPAGQSLMDCARGLVFSMQSDASFFEQCLGAIVHVECHQEIGFYLRAMFFVVPGEMGFRQQFQARVVRLWQAIVGRGGWIQDRRGHQNKIIGGLGAVSVKDDASILRLKKAMFYGVQKDLCMRVDAGQSTTFLTVAVQPMRLGIDRGFLPFNRVQS
ncbi:MAG: hypothetical protein ACOY9J_13210 [Pseudomonadota bacterium]